MIMWKQGLFFYKATNFQSQQWAILDKTLKIKTKIFSVFYREVSEALQNPTVYDGD